MSTRTLRGKVAVVGVGETTYYRHGKSPVSEFKLALQAILAACADGGIDPRRIDGFASYSNDRNDPSRLAAALGLPALRFSNMNWAPIAWAASSIKIRLCSRATASISFMSQAKPKR